MAQQSDTTIIGDPAGGTALQRTALYDLHVANGGRMVPFAGYELPIQYPSGILAEHHHTRLAAGLFDVSHMGPAILALRTPPADPDTAFAEIAKRLERLVPSDIQGLRPGQMRYSVLLNETGGVLDDLMVVRPPVPGLKGALYVIVNAGCKDADFALFEEVLGEDVAVRRRDIDCSLLALQGPEAAEIMAEYAPNAAHQGFMTMSYATYKGAPLVIMRSGYTGEDGYEILVPNTVAKDFAESLLAEDAVKLIGLGARDSLRLEAGLCLYGHDLTPDISPIEADLRWVVQKRRRDLRDFPGADRILDEFKQGPRRLRVGFQMKDRAPAREGAEVFIGERRIGVVTSGGFGGTANAAIGMALVSVGANAIGTEIEIPIRGTIRKAEIVAMPFVPHQYYRG